MASLLSCANFGVHRLRHVGMATPKFEIWSSLRVFGRFSSVSEDDDVVVIAWLLREFVSQKATQYFAAR